MAHACDAVSPAGEFRGVCGGSLARQLQRGVRVR